MKTVTVRIALVVNSNGEWAAGGWESAKDADKMDVALDTIAADGSPEARYWLTAEVELPEVVEVKTSVEKA